MIVIDYHVGPKLPQHLNDMFCIIDYEFVVIEPEGKPTLCVTESMRVGWLGGRCRLRPLRPVLQLADARSRRKLMDAGSFGSARQEHAFVAACVKKSRQVGDPGQVPFSTIPESQQYPHNI
jgi:hypothetical protein